MKLLILAVKVRKSVSGPEEAEWRVSIEKVKLGEVVDKREIEPLT